MSHRIRVPQAWVDEGGVIEVELPRHLCCAACNGGGCDLCERSGALTLRNRDEPAEIVEVRLSRPEPQSAPSSRTFVIRIPEQGGLPPDGEDVPRGHLLLAVTPGDAADAKVKLVGRLSISPAAREPAPVAPSSPRPSGDFRRVVLIAVLVALWIAVLVYVRLSGIW